MIVGFKSKNHPQQVRKHGANDGVDERITPDSIFAPLHATYSFTLDAAANARNARVQKFYSLEQDGLIQSWRGERVWCNPPFSNLIGWVDKALREINSGCPLVVMMLPANRCEQPFWQQLIEPIRDRGLGIKTNFLPGRPRFGWPAGRVRPVKGDRPPFGIVIVTFTPRNS